VTADDLLVKVTVLAGSCVVMLLLLMWYVYDPDDH
jgi:hypothetical protein